jgi:hypothetical protein
MFPVAKPNQPLDEEKLHLRVFSILWLVPIYTDISPESVCPGKKIRAINMYDSFLDGFICGASAAIICPATVGIQCTK